MYVSLAPVSKRTKQFGISLSSGNDLQPLTPKSLHAVSVKIARNGSGNLEPSTGGVTGACSIFPTCKNFLEFEINLQAFQVFCFLPPSCPNTRLLALLSLLFSCFLTLQFYQQFPLYDSISGSWRHLALSLSVLLPVTGSNGSPTCTLLSSSNGLFCFSLPSSYSLLVCNFLAKSSRIVEFPSYPFSFDSLTFVSRPFGYKIFVLCSTFSSNSVFVYDSKIHSWQQFGPFEPILGDDYRQEGVLFDGSLYFTTSEPFSIACFDLESGRWERLDSELPGDLAFVRLVSDGENKLYLIGGVGRNGISRGVKLWELGDGRNWIEVESLPEMMCKKFVSVCYHNYERVYCFWHQGMICICCYTWPEILYCKVSRRTWHWHPKCPSLPEKWSCGFRWFSFVPELNAAV